MDFGYGVGVADTGFRGYLRNVMVNGELLDFAGPLRDEEVVLGYGCTCANGGTCVGPEQCDCAPEFTGPDCSEGKYCGRGLCDRRACVMGGTYVMGGALCDGRGL